MVLTVINRLSRTLGPLQERSGHDFELFTHLINLYLQLPGRLDAAVELMGWQCQRLLEQRDHTLLPDTSRFSPT